MSVKESDVMEVNEREKEKSGIGKDTRTRNQKNQKKADPLLAWGRAPLSRRRSRALRNEVSSDLL